ncbi:hypothetical protein, partial [Eggerthella sinensis]|uniref:hypothetical protein n=1 Tax=Eggerthella sinensis TaxID=242230 RepID=UPI001B87B05B
YGAGLALRDQQAPSRRNKGRKKNAKTSYSSEQFLLSIRIIRREVNACAYRFNEIIRNRFVRRRF